MKFILIPIFIFVFNLLFFHLFNIPVDLMLVYVITIAFMYGEWIGFCSGIYAGFLLDISSADPFGMNLLILSIVGLVTGIIKKYLPFEIVLLRIPVMLLIAFVVGIMRQMFLMLYYPDVFRFDYLWIVNMSLYSTLIFLIIALALYKYEYTD